MNPDSYVLRLTGRQYNRLQKHLYPGDGLEAGVLLLCGLRFGNRVILTVHEVFPLPHEKCIRKPASHEWQTALGRPIYEKSAKREMAVVKIHSHPGGLNDFSAMDDHSDEQLLDSLQDWTNKPLPHGSCVMLPDGYIFGRVIRPSGEFDRISRISVAGDNISFFGLEKTASKEADRRNIQTFGKGTINKLHQLKIGIVGCSGTGSWVAEQIARLGIGELLLVDPDVIEFKNLNRIVNSKASDAVFTRKKTEVIGCAVANMGFGTVVRCLSTDLAHAEVVYALADCDVLFGCLDSQDGRDLLNRIAVFYNIPYFDVGVRIVADNEGGVSHIAGRCCYLQPDGSSLLSRGYLHPEVVASHAIWRNDPAEYHARLQEGYIANINVDNPAVSSVNGYYASLTVNDFLARLHGFRDDPTSYEDIEACLIENFIICKPKTDYCPTFAKRAGRGDCRPLIDNPLLGIP